LSTSTIAGFLEELDIREILPPRQSLRRNIGNLAELVASIEGRGLLQPIVVRPTEGGFELVAGSRRLEACKRLRLGKIPCHIVEMDEREAFETSLIENIQRQTLDPIEEAEALKRYVDEYGYGSVSELAAKIGMSEEYVSHRIGLLELPPDVLEKVSRRLLTPSHAAELRGLGVDKQLNLADRIVQEHITSKQVRRIARRARTEPDGRPAFLVPSPLSFEDRRKKAVDRTFSRCIGALKITMLRFDSAIEGIEEFDWAVMESLLENRRIIHQQIDNLMRLKRKTQRARVYLVRNWA
jgi:ParB family transcriptional regulator, chromosome partitioning protein